MKETVVLASQNEDLTWEAIRAADHIWCQSFFMGDSAQLFTRLLNRAVAEGVRDKVLFNLADRPEAYSELFSSEPNALELIKTLKLNQNIKFFFWEEIAEMMHVSIYP
jgi:hypothetical protein